MVKKYLFILAATALAFTSCIKDDSTEGGDGVSVISLQTPLNSSYTLNQGDTLKINLRCCKAMESRNLPTNGR